MKLKLPDTVATSQDLAELTAEIHDYAKWAARTAIKQRVSKKSSGARPELTAEATELLHTWTGGKDVTPANLEDLLAHLEAYRKNAPTITITLAAVPSGELKAKLVNWCRTHLAADMLVSFRLNRHILGGMVVVYRSHIFDWSFRRKLLDSPLQLREVLQHV